MTTIKDNSGDIRLTRRVGYWLIEQDFDVISLTDDSMYRLLIEYDKYCWENEDE